MHGKELPDLTFTNFYVTHDRSGYQVHIHGHVTNNSTRVLHKEELPHFAGVEAESSIEYRGLMLALPSNMDIPPEQTGWVLKPGQSATVSVSIEKDEALEQVNWQLYSYPWEGREITFEGFDVVASIIQNELSLELDPRYKFPHSRPIEAGTYLGFLESLRSCVRDPSDDPEIVPLRFSSLTVEHDGSEPKPLSSSQKGDAHIKLRGIVENVSEKYVPSSAFPVPHNDLTGRSGLPPVLRESENVTWLQMAGMSSLAPGESTAFTYELPSALIQRITEENGTSHRYYACGGWSFETHTKPDGLPCWFTGLEDIPSLIEDVSRELYGNSDENALLTALANGDPYEREYLEGVCDRGPYYTAMGDNAYATHSSPNCPSLARSSVRTVSGIWVIAHKHHWCNVCGGWRW